MCVLSDGSGAVNFFNSITSLCPVDKYVFTFLKADCSYHLKYMYVGDEPKLEVEKVIKNLRTSLQLRLRFIAHHTTIDGAAIAPTPTN